MRRVTGNIIKAVTSLKSSEKRPCFYWRSESYDCQIQITCSISGQADLQVFSRPSGERMDKSMGETMVFLNIRQYCWTEQINCILNLWMKSLPILNIHQLLWHLPISANSLSADKFPYIVSWKDVVLGLIVVTPILN